MKDSTDFFLSIKPSHSQNKTEGPAEIFNITTEMTYGVPLDNAFTASADNSDSLGQMVGHGNVSISRRLFIFAKIHKSYLGRLSG